MKKIKLKSEEILIVREAEKKDAQALLNYIRIVSDETHYLSFGSDEFTTSLEQEEKIIQDHHDSKNRIFLIGEINQEIAGIINVNASHKKRSLHVGEFGITVLQQHWNKGIAHVLIQEMIDWAKHSDVIRKLKLEVQEDNVNAIHLYQKFGFEQEGIERRGAFVNDRFYSLIHMGLLVD